MSRYNKTKRVRNSSEYYKPLRKPRDLRSIIHHATPRLHNPTARERSPVKTTKHIWKYGDRLYKLAYQYYGDENFWWVIAWYNGYPTETHIKTGTTLWIPLNIEIALKVLRA